MSVDQRVAQILECSLDQLGTVASADSDGGASKLAMLELVATGAATHPDSFRFEFLLLNLVRSGLAS